jgi:hypothetical protein
MSKDWKKKLEKTDFGKGYEMASEECAEKLKEGTCLEEYIEGYKYGFRDGYNAAMEDIKAAMAKAGVRVKVAGEGAEDVPDPRIVWPWP